MNFEQLNYTEFEALIAELFRREGYKVLSLPDTARLVGADFEAEAPDGTLCFVEVKHPRRDARLPHIVVLQLAADLKRLKGIRADVKAILVTSSPVGTDGRKLLSDFPFISIWDEPIVERLLNKHDDLARAVGAHVKQAAQFSATLHASVASSPTRLDGLERKIRSLNCGSNEWKAFEILGVDVLNTLFTPELGPADTQSRSDDGLDILDAIFPIRSFAPEWQQISRDFGTRFVVAEFKNSCDEIGQREVESLSQYLWPKAFRTFGVLWSRKPPSEHACIARRRAWVESSRMIVMVSDDDVVDMIKIKAEGRNPLSLMNSQLEDFLRTLNP